MYCTGLIMLIQTRSKRHEREKASPCPSDFELLLRPPRVESRGCLRSSFDPRVACIACLCESYPPRLTCPLHQRCSRRASELLLFVGASGHTDTPLSLSSCVRVPVYSSSV